MDPKVCWSMDLLSLRLFPSFVLAVLLDRNNSGSEFLTVGWQPHPSTRCSVFLLKVDTTSSLSFLLGISSKFPPFDYLESLTPRPLVYARGLLYLLPPKVACFHSLLLGLRASLLCPPRPIHGYVLLLLPPPFSHPGPSIPLSPVIAFFSLPHGIEASVLGPFGFLTFLNSVDYILYFFG